MLVIFVPEKMLFVDVGLEIKDKKSLWDKYVFLFGVSLFNRKNIANESIFLQFYTVTKSLFKLVCRTGMIFF